MLIVIEGCDASGKATQSKLLATALNGHRISFPRYDGPLGDLLANHLAQNVMLCDMTPMLITGSMPEVSAADPVVLQSLMLMDKYSAAPEILERTRTEHVILDRYWQSACCYAVEDGLPDKLISDAQSCLPRADMNIFLDVPPEVSFARRPVGRDRYEKDRDKLMRVYRRYKQLWSNWERTEPGKWVSIDANRFVEDVHVDIKNNVLDIVKNA